MPNCDENVHKEDPERKIRDPGTDGRTAGQREHLFSDPVLRDPRRRQPPLREIHEDDHW